MTYRNRALLDLAAIAPHCMSCGKPNDGSVVSAHANGQAWGKGAGLKAADWAVAFCCDTCHTAIDRGKESGEDRQWMWDAAHRATMDWLFTSGWLVVRPADYIAPAEPVKPKARVRRSRPLSGGAKLPGGGKIQSRNTLRKKP